MARNNAILMGDKVIPVLLYPLQKSEASPFKMACPDCKGDIGQKQFCKECERDGKRSDWLKAIPVGKEKHVFTAEQTASLKKLDKGITVYGQEPMKSLDLKRISGCWALDPPADTKVIGLKKFQSQWKQIQAGLENAGVYLVVKYIETTEKAGIIIAQDGRLFLLGMKFETHYNGLDEIPEIAVEKSKVDAASKGLQALKEIKVSSLENSITQKIEQILENPEAEIIEIEAVEPEDDSLF